MLVLLVSLETYILWSLVKNLKVAIGWFFETGSYTVYVHAAFKYAKCADSDVVAG